MTLKGEKLKMNYTIEIIGNGKYGEKPYEIQERIGHYALCYIVYGYSPNDALDNLAEYLDRIGSLANPYPEDNHEDYYYGAGFYPFYLPDISVQEITESKVNEIRFEQGKLK